MDDLDTREWLLTNGLGSFASGTVCDARTRKYHGWLIAAIDPPGRRNLLLSHLEASLEIAGQVQALATNYWADKIEPWGYRLLRSFSIEPVPTWQWGQRDWQLSRQIVMPHGLSEAIASNDCFPMPCQRVLIRYHYQGREPAILRLRPLIGDRDFHQRQQQEPTLSFSQLVGPHQLLLQAFQAGRIGTPWQLRWTHGHYYPDEVWYWSFYYPEEAKRGLDCLEDLYSPGYLTVLLQPNEPLTLEASVGLPQAGQPRLDATRFDAAVHTEQHRLKQDYQDFPGAAAPVLLPDPLLPHLLRASDRFITYQTVATEPRIIAGYHWFGDRSRETLLCVPGFALTPQRFQLARRLLNRLGQSCCQGLIPNVIPDSGADPVFRSIDCSLWWLETLGLYLEATQDWDFLVEQYTIVKQIYKSFTAGTLHNIRVDASDGLLTWDDASVALTWMDTLVGEQPVTPRHGKPIEINALWYSALCWASQWATRLAQYPTRVNLDRLQNQARRYTEQAEQVKHSLQKYWNARLGYLYDRIEPDDRLDATVRPNAVVALSLHHCAFSEAQARQILQVARDQLLTPFGLRSLDPADPAYVGRYQGNPEQRDRAAHQGTVWSWLLGPFLRAWLRVHGAQVPLPLDLQPIFAHFAKAVSFDAISEMFDGDAPHTPRGTIAHAVVIAELLRCWEQLNPIESDR
jgi:4-alpha-glucanotransferase